MSVAAGRPRAALAALALAAVLSGLAGCGSVTLPEHRFYRLRLPDPSGGRAMRGGVLRIEGLSIAADLAGDSLHVVHGPVWVQRYELHHWAGPLERLVTDALVTGLGRSRAFAQVKSGGDRGGEDYVLTGRVLEFHQAASDGEWVAAATLDLTVVDASGKLVLHAELHREARLRGPGPEDLAIALSDALGGIVDDFLARCDAAGMFDRAIDSTPPGR